MCTTKGSARPRGAGKGARAWLSRGDTSPCNRPVPRPCLHACSRVRPGRPPPRLLVPAPVALRGARPGTTPKRRSERSRWAGPRAGSAKVAPASGRSLRTSPRESAARRETAAPTLTPPPPRHPALGPPKAAGLPGGWGGDGRGGLKAAGLC